MNSLHAPPACRLAFGVSRLSLRPSPQSRLLATVVTASTPTPTTPTETEAPREKTRAERDAEEGRVHGHLPDHGQKIWIHNHTYNGHIVYSFTRVMDINKAYRQLPYTGKKNVPAKLRKDYWRPMALIDLGPGLGEVGRNVYQKLREFKKRHELEWGRDDPEEEKKLLNMTKQQRGKELNNQRPNAVADVAAVLAGVGKGSKMWMVDWADLGDKRVFVSKPGREKLEGVAVLAEKEKTGQRMWARMERFGVEVREAGEAGERKFVDWQNLVDMAVQVKGAKEVEVVRRILEKRKGGGEIVKEVRETEVVADEEKTFELEPLKKLHKATIYWANREDLRFAKDWSNNVEHVIGLPKYVKPQPTKQKKALEGVPESKSEAQPPAAA